MTLLPEGRGRHDEHSMQGNPFYILPSQYTHLPIPETGEMKKKKGVGEGGEHIIKKVYKNLLT